MLLSMSPLVLLAASSGVQAAVANRTQPFYKLPMPLPPKAPLNRDPAVVTSPNGTALPPLDTVYYFDQLIDHNDPSAGTFQQRYWYSYEYYESGGPIVLFTPGEIAADGYEIYLTNQSINGMIAQQQTGSAVVIEHRFFGYSNPRPNLTVESLQLLTVEQAVLDLAYFAQNAVLPQPGGDQLAPGKAPWVLVGGSYSGALTAFTKVNQSDLFWAAYASSAVVEGIVDFWGYFDIPRQFMPANCSTDLEEVISFFDTTIASGSEEDIQSIKDTFGLNFSHIEDLAYARKLAIPLEYWQEMSPADGTEDFFYQFCDALEVKDGVSAPSTGWGLDYAYPTYGSWYKNYFFPAICGDLSADDCLGSYDANSTTYTDTDINNSGRSWEWFICNWFGWWANGAPENVPTIVSRYVVNSWWETQCTYYFPEQFSTLLTPDVSSPNGAYGGWSMQSDRLFFATGLRDPWRDATMSADGTNIQSTAQQPIVESDGFHCSDLLQANAVDATVANVQSQALAYMKAWLAEWQPSA